LFSDGLVGMKGVTTLKGWLDVVDRWNAALNESGTGAFLWLQGNVNERDKTKRTIYQLQLHCGT
jgi:hypothetical protein